MCFSPSASFAASAGLAVIGVASFAKAKKEQKMIALIPLLFAVQQALEGVQWITERPSVVSTVALYGYLFFAFLLWPTYVPIAVYRLDTKRRNILRWFVALGVTMTIFLGGVLLLRPISVGLSSWSINYNVVIPFYTVVNVIYLSIICGSLIVSSKRVIRWLGVAVFFLAIFAMKFFFATFISVWCFFSALLSSFIYFFF